jgi:hypothetical protein
MTKDELIADDIIQRLRDATVEILDTHPDVMTLTGRESLNVVPASQAGSVSLPVIVFTHVVSTELAADGDTRDPLIQFTAYANDDDDDIANALIRVVERAYEGPAFLSLDPPIDAYVTRRIRRTVSPGKGTARADMDVTLRVYQPVSA